jgi:hypothetical protein
MTGFPPTARQIESGLGANLRMAGRGIGTYAPRGATRPDSDLYG